MDQRHQRMVTLATLNCVMMSDYLRDRFAQVPFFG